MTTQGLIELHDLLHRSGVDGRVAVMRHKPDEPALRQALRWYAVEEPDLYNAYQREHGEGVERMLVSSQSLVSCVADGPKRALFVGVYAVDGYRRITSDEFHAIPENQRLTELGTRGPDGRDPLWFDLRLTEHLASLKGRLVIGWTSERSYCQWVRTPKFPVVAIHEESALTPHAPDPRTLSMTWAELNGLPPSLRHALSQWRGVYFIFDSDLKRGYVGSAYGGENIYQRWMNYKVSGHGGNVQLRRRAPAHFVFSVLELTAPTAPPDEVIALETSWKKRLNTRKPYGLNDN